MNAIDKAYEASVKAHNAWADAYWTESADKVAELYKAKEIALATLTDARIASFEENN